MYLKSLTLVGFKSFAEKTMLEFLPGVTAIVGPNGCGKSNVADAIRWVLGEQSAKALRGSEMADVIFSGTDGRKPINLAEVSMTFADVDPKLLSLPGVNLEFTEITITRRVHRDGAGEYFINKTPCRLRDIQNLFMDTGIGRSSYSLMAQGQIDQILSAHPEDRRLIFEEAAGISKYKHQKKEAIRKLDLTEANLVRITDVVKEVKRQIISLQRQAGKARRYKELFDELKGLETRLARHRFDGLHSAIAALEAQIVALAAQSEQYAGEISQHEAQIDQLRRSLAEIERAINDTINRDHEFKAETDRHQQRATTNGERIIEHDRLIENHRREIAGNEERIRVGEADLIRLNAEFTQMDAELATAQGRLQEQEIAYRQLQAELAEKNAALDGHKSGLLAAEGAITRHRNELAALDHKKKNDLQRTDRLSAEKLQLEDERRDVERQIAEFNQGLIELRQTSATLRTQLPVCEAALADAIRQLREATQQHDASVSEVSRKSTRLEVLRQLFAAPDGRSTLGNIIETDPQYGAAIEAALSQTLRTVLADDLNAAREFLAGNQKNPAVTAPELVGRMTSCGAASGDAAYKTASSVVRVKDGRFEPLIRSLLRDVVIVENLDAALALRQSQPELSVATLPGQFVSAHGILSAVSTSHIAELAALTEDSHRLQLRVNELAGHKAGLEQRQTELTGVLNRHRTECHEKEILLAGKDAELSLLAAQQREFEHKVQTVMFELNSLEQQDATERNRREEIFAACTEAETRQATLQQELVGAQQAVDTLQARREELFAKLGDLKVAVGGVQHKRASIQAQRDPIDGRIRDLRDRMATCAAEVTAFTGRIEQFRQEITESEQRVGELAGHREQLQQTLAGYQHQRDEVAAGIAQAEADLKQLRHKATETQQQKSGIDVALTQKRMEIQSLKERIFQKYQLNVEEIAPDAFTVTVADKGPAVSEQVPRATDWDAIEQQVTELQSKLDAMGPVNAEAIQEYDELEGRFKFLTQQHDDLVKAKEQLLQVISRINSTTKQLFGETFEKVRANFQTMFTELFGGGKANLLLLDENDPLESGIEIVAKPPGKQLQSITLLSGGEKTLTATALLFSIYMVKPSPFCVLDELDAPLDESNINRFVRILQRFITQSQFVIITHSKRTIGMADALYGITMEEHGVSKVVSVKFSPRQETARKAVEQARKSQEDRIDGAADVRPHEEPIRNDLLLAKEETVAAITNTTPVVAEQAPTLAPPPAEAEALKAEVQAAVANAVAVGEQSKEAALEPPKQS
jgi:chromosome segregation protein